MRILLVETCDGRAMIWSKFIERHNHEVIQALNVEDATRILIKHKFDMIIVNSSNLEQDTCDIIDYAIMKNPRTAVIAVTSDSFFSDGSLFQILPNLHAQLSHPVQIDDLHAVIDYYSEQF